MDLHPEYGLTLLKDTYNVFQTDSFNKDACDQLRADKWKTCHPNNSDLPPCTADMTIDQLHTLFKKHQSCYQFRVAENQSLCFDKPDPGHIKAERIELNHTEQCRLLLDTKNVLIDTNTPDTNTPDTNKPDTNKPDTNKPDPSKPAPSKPDTNKPAPSTKDTKLIKTKIDVKLIKYKWWVYVLGILAIVGIGVFLFYVY